MSEYEPILDVARAKELAAIVPSRPGGSGTPALAVAKSDGMTVGQLREILAGQPDDLRLVVDLPAEGARYSETILSVKPEMIKPNSLGAAPGPCLLIVVE